MTVVIVAWRKVRVMWLARCFKVIPTGIYGFHMVCSGELMKIWLNFGEVSCLAVVDFGFKSFALLIYVSRYYVRLCCSHTLVIQTRLLNVT